MYLASTFAGMFRKIAITFFVIILIASGIVGYMHYMNLKKPVSAAINAIPEDACLIIESKNTLDTWKGFNTSSVLWRDLKNLGIFKKLNTDLLFIDSVLNNNDKIASAIAKNSVLLSYHAVANNSLEALLVVNVPNNIEENTVIDIIKNNVDPSTYFSQRYYKNTIIFEIKYNQHPQTLSYTKIKGNFIASFSPALIEASIDQLISGKSLAKDETFSKIYNSTGNDADANIFMNYDQLQVLTNAFCNDKGKALVHSFKKIAKWSVLDLKLNNSSALLSGITVATPADYLYTFKNIKPQKSTIAAIAPKNTAYFASYCFDSFKNYSTNYKNYLSKAQTFKTYAKSMDSLSNLYRVNVEDVFNNLLSREIGSIKVNNGGDSLETEYIVVQTLNPNLAQTALASLSKESSEELVPSEKEKKESSKKKKEESKKKKKDEKKETEDNSVSTQKKDDETIKDTSLTVLDSTTYKKPLSEIKQLKTANIFELLLGPLFKNVHENYYTIIDNYIVFANSPEALRKINKQYRNGGTLAESDTYKRFVQNIAQETNLNLYCSTPNAMQNLAALLNTSTAIAFIDYLDILSKSEGVAAQITNSNDMLLTNFYVNYNPEYKKEEVSALRAQLDAPVSQKPFIVTNHTNNQKEIIVQDDANNLYLISHNNEILWKRQLDEKIMSDIVQIDKLKNKKLQYIFNSKNKIYIIDRNGKDVEKFPLELKAPATTPLMVFDYENRKDYRLMIACENKRIYNYDIDGGAIGGWNNEPWANTISVAPYHFVIKGKDYLSIIEDDGQITLVDRKGKVIAALKNKLILNARKQVSYEIRNSIEKSCIVATDNKGTIQKVYINDKTEKINTTAVAANHFFISADLNDDGEYEYILIDNNKLYAYNKEGKSVFTRNFRQAISQKPQLFNTTENLYKLGLVSSSANEIYLLNTDGSLDSNFPKQGSTPFSLADIDKDGELDAIVGYNGSFIYTYSSTK